MSWFRMSRLSFALVLVLALGEGALLAFAATPDVSPDYRAYYIDRTTGCLPRQVSGEYVLDTKVLLAEDQPQRAFNNIAICGFAHSEPGGAWLRGPEARLRMLQEEANPGDLVFDVEARGAIDGTWRRQQANVFVNGTQVGTFDYSDGEFNTQSVKIPARLLRKAGSIDIYLTMTDTRPADAPRAKRDSRRFSLFVRSVRLRVLQ